ncbi:MAG: class I SAM-dependent methyltransferase [Desulfobacterales bacterium]|jgi:tetratricopeptide (TPR) repeat protein|nr:class I SAM-dependent methyltransferase [Desulfobacterales bacterium]
MNSPLFSLSFDFGCPADFAGAQAAVEAPRCHPDAFYRYANALAANSHHQLAGEVFLAATAQRCTASAEAVFRAGVCQLLNGAFGEAALTLEAALAAFPERCDLHSCLGVAYYHLGLMHRVNTHWWAAFQIDATVETRSMVNRFLRDEHHPERLALVPICTGKGIDVGCGNRKTHPGAIGVDLIPPGSKGTAGCVSGKISVADVVASGDHLPMFADNELDYVVQEWKRIVKPGGLIGMVVPDDEVCDTIRLDPTHKHVFTQASLARAIDLVGGMRIIQLSPLLKSWSFLCVGQKAHPPSEDTARWFDYEAAVRRFEKDAVLQRAQAYENAGDIGKSAQIRIYMQRRR